MDQAAADNNKKIKPLFFGKIVIIFLMAFLVVNTIINMIVVIRQDTGIYYTRHNFNQSLSNYDFIAELNETQHTILKALEDNNIHVINK